MITIILQRHRSVMRLRKIPFEADSARKRLVDEWQQEQLVLESTPKTTDRPTTESGAQTNPKENATVLSGAAARRVVGWLSKAVGVATGSAAPLKLTEPGKWKWAPEGLCDKKSLHVNFAICLVVLVGGIACLVAGSSVFVISWLLFGDAILLFPTCDCYVDLRGN